MRWALSGPATLVALVTVLVILVVTALVGLTTFLSFLSATVERPARNYPHAKFETALDISRREFQTTSRSDNPIPRTVEKATPDESE